MNLLINAAQAMGRWTIVVTLTKSGSLATIEVRDTGPGIPLEIRAQVFDPFFTTKARRRPGTPDRQTNGGTSRWIARARLPR